MLGLPYAPLGAKPSPRGECRPAHQPRCPDVAEDLALIAYPVHRPSLAEQLFELGAALLGDLLAHLGDLLFHV